MMAVIIDTPVPTVETVARIMGVSPARAKEIKHGGCAPRLETPPCFQRRREMGKRSRGREPVGVVIASPCAARRLPKHPLRLRIL